MYAHALGQPGKVQLGAGQVELGAGLGADALGTDSFELDLEHRVGCVVEDDAGDVELLARHRPQRLDGVHRRAVADQRQHRPIRAGNGGTDGIRQALADRAAGQGDQIVRRRAGGHGRQHQSGGDRLVDHNCVFRHQVAERLADLFSRQPTTRTVGASRGLNCGHGVVGTQRQDQRFEAGARVLFGAGQHMHLAAFRHQFAGLARIGEKRHRCLGIDQHQMIQPIELHAGQFGQIR